MARIDYLAKADELNATLPHEGKKYAKIYCWVNRYNSKQHGVEVCICGKFQDVATNIPRRDMMQAVDKAYNLICKRLKISAH